MPYIKSNSTRPQLTCHPARLVIHIDLNQAPAFARWTDQAAHLALDEKRFVLAERLSHTVYEARRRSMVSR